MFGSHPLIVRTIAIFFLWLGILLGVDYAIFHYRLADFKAYLSIPDDSSSAYSLFDDAPAAPDHYKGLGWLQPEVHWSDNGFHRFPKKKPSNTYRIGCFGDSYTFGLEVTEEYSYPNFLRKRLPPSHVGMNWEIINFGIPGYGFHQIYLLFEKIGRDYELDHLLFGPASFWPDRELCFKTNIGPDIHARYILSETGVELLSFVGRADRFDQYLRFFPRWLYLRYDRMAPFFLRSLIPFELGMKNPFYYTRLSVQEEAIELYRRLLVRVAKEARQVDVFHLFYKDLIDSKALIDGMTETEPPLPNMTFGIYNGDKLMGFPYRMPGGHLSPNGNDVIARFYACIVGKIRRCTFPLLSIHYLKNNSKGPTEPSDRKAVVAIDLFHRERHFASVGYSELVEELGAQGGSGPSILFLKDKNEETFDMPHCLVLPIQVGDGEMISVRDENGHLLANLATLSKPDPLSPIAFIESSYSWVFSIKRVAISGVNRHRSELRIPPGSGLYIGEKKIAEFTVNNQAEPMGPNLIRYVHKILRLHDHSYIDPEALVDKDLLDIVLTFGGGRSKRFPFLSVVKRTLQHNVLFEVGNNR